MSAKRGCPWHIEARSHDSRPGWLCHMGDSRRNEPIRRAPGARIAAVAAVGGSVTLDLLHGIEGARIRASDKLMAERVGVPWHARRYDRTDPLAAGLPDRALDRAASAVEAAAIAVSGLADTDGIRADPDGIQFSKRKQRGPRATAAP